MQASWSRIEGKTDVDKRNPVAVPHGVSHVFVFVFVFVFLLQVKLTGTNAILRHIARKHNLCGRSEEEMVRVDMAAEQVMDMR